MEVYTENIQGISLVIHSRLRRYLLHMYVEYQVSGV